MRTTTLVLATLILMTAFVAAAPAAEARQVCTYGTGDPCDDHVVCVWNRLTAQWDCVGHVDPCWFRCWGP